MNITTQLLVGLATLGLPGLLLAWIFFRGMRPVFWFIVALIAVGLGYLTTTGAASEIGAAVLQLLTGQGAPIEAN